jgi:hypothetical protein
MFLALVNSMQHDACITWRVGNGTVLLQNLVRFSEECAPSKIKFWSNFIDLYYRGTGGNVQCCTGNGCNLGTMQQAEINRFSPDMQPLNAEVISGLPAELPGASLSTFLQQTSAYQPPQPGVSIQQGMASPQFQVGIFMIYINPSSSFTFKLCLHRFITKSIPVKVRQFEE